MKPKKMNKRLFWLLSSPLFPRKIWQKSSSFVVVIVVVVVIVIVVCMHMSFLMLYYFFLVVGKCTVWFFNIFSWCIYFFCSFALLFFILFNMYFNPNSLYHQKSSASATKKEILLSFSVFINSIQEIHRKRVVVGGSSLVH